MISGIISPTKIAVTGLKAQRTRMNVIANNIANMNATRTPQGGPYRRQMAVFRGEQLGRSFDRDEFGVRVKDVVADQRPFRMIHDPSHPDANEEGYVAYPNVDLPMEMVNLVSAQRAYDANTAVITSDKRMKQKALEIIQA